MIDEEEQTEQEGNLAPAEEETQNSKKEDDPWAESADKFGAKEKLDEPCPYCNENSLYEEPSLDEFGGKARFIMMGCFGRSQRYICVNPGCRAYYANHKARIKRKVSGKLGFSHPLGSFLNGNPFHIDR